MSVFLSILAFFWFQADVKSDSQFVITSILRDQFQVFDAYDKKLDAERKEKEKQEDEQE